MRKAALALLLACACGKQEFPQTPPAQRAKPLQEFRAIPSYEREPLRVGGDVTAPVAIRKVDPKIVKGPHERSFFIFEVIITREGDVREVRFLKGPDDAQTQAIIGAIKQWKYKPGRRRGEPVDVYYNLTVTFELR